MKQEAQFAQPEARKSLTRLEMGVKSRLGSLALAVKSPGPFEPPFRKSGGGGTEGLFAL